MSTAKSVILGCISTVSLITATTIALNKKEMTLEEYEECEYKNHIMFSVQEMLNIMETEDKRKISLKVKESERLLGIKEERERRLQELRKAFENFKGQSNDPTGCLPNKS